MSESEVLIEFGDRLDPTQRAVRSTPFRPPAEDRPANQYRDHRRDHWIPERTVGEVLAGMARAGIS